jgi:N-acetylneuraminic acid mutarotase
MKKLIVQMLQTLVLAIGGTSSAFAQGSAFIYQGRLLDSTNPATGLYEMQFTLFDTSTNGNQVATPLNVAPVAVSNGLFTASLDFGTAPFNGAPRWLEIALRVFGSSVPPTVLVPRQPLAPTPYALFAGIAGTVPDGAITAPKLAGGAAAANLRDAGLSAVASGGVVLSEQASATDLLGAGYIKVGRVDLIEESWRARSNGPALLAPPPLARTGHSAVWTGSEMIIWGGTDGIPRNNGARYNPAANSWTLIAATNVITPRFGHSAVWTGTEVIIYGGAAGGIFGGTTSTNTGARYNPATGAWTAITPGGGTRRNHVAVWTGTRMLVWGGTFTGSGTFGGQTEVPQNSGALYDPVADSWTFISGTGAPNPRFGYSAVWTGSELMVWGGYTFIGSFISTRTNFNDGARYNVAANTWTPITTAGAPFRRDSHSAVWSGSQMIVWGGQFVEGSFDVLRTNYNDGARYNPAANTWSSLNGVAAPPPRYNHTAVWAGDRMTIWGGTDGTNIFETGGRYFPTANAWSNMTITARPSPRSGYSTVWSGSEMIVWGGFDSNNYYFDVGGGYNPVTDVWRSTAPTGERSERRGHTAVWTGNELIVWGGFDGERYLNTGGRFNPALNSWIPISTNNAPAGRVAHSAVWTGAEMIVWGGTGTNSLNSGGRYNPLADTWTATATAGTPVVRSNHSAIWTGSEMVIWGGADAAFRNTGGRYNPVANTWSATATGAPSARSQHTAVWTGNEMLVWGGTGGTVASPVPLLTGGRYNPTSNSWSALPTSGAPAARTGHKAVWSGAEMLVWGGTDLTTNLNTGGRYHVVSNRWSDITTNNAPSPRVEYTAVWDGTRMIVWGGFNSSAFQPYLQTGGGYNPLTDAWFTTQAGTNNAPARSQHTAAWTGDAMIIHGGWDGSAYFDDTYLYAPPRTMFLYLKP